MKNFDKTDVPTPVSDEKLLQEFKTLANNEPSLEISIVPEAQNDAIEEGFIRTMMRLMQNPGSGGAMLLLALVLAFLFLSDLNHFKSNQYLFNLPPLIEAPTIHEYATESISENNNKDISEIQHHDGGSLGKRNGTHRKKYFNKVPHLEFLHSDIKPVNILDKKAEPIIEKITCHYDPGDTKRGKSTRFELLQNLYKSNFSYCDKLGFRLDLDNPELIFTEKAPENSVQLNLEVMKNSLASYHSKKAEQFNTAYAIWEYNEKINDQLVKYNQLNWQINSISSTIDSMSKRFESSNISCKIVFISGHADCTNLSVEKDKSYILLAEAVEKFRNRSIQCIDSGNKTISANSSFSKTLLQQLLYRTGPDDNWKILNTDQMHFISNPGGKIEICTDIPTSVETNEYLIKLFSYNAAAYLNSVEDNAKH